MYIAKPKTVEPMNIRNEDSVASEILCVDDNREDLQDPLDILLKREEELCDEH